MDDTKPFAAKSMEVESFLLRFPEQMRPAYRRLLYYAAMPLVLTPELLHYLRNAFVREAPWVAEADLLLADNLFEEKNFEQYVMATPVRTLLLREGAEQLGGRNMQEAARLLVSYLYRHLPFSSLSPSEVTAQRWAALLYLDDYHDKVVAEIVQALHEALSASDAVSGYEGRAAFESMLEVINQIAPTLADQPELVDLARLTQSLLHEEIDPGSISQERLMQSPVVAGVQLPAIGRILRTMGAAPTVELGSAAVLSEASEAGDGERRFQLRATIPSRLVVGTMTILHVEVVPLKDTGLPGDAWPQDANEMGENASQTSPEVGEDEAHAATDFTLPLSPVGEGQGISVGNLASQVIESPVRQEGTAEMELTIRVTAPGIDIANDEQVLVVNADSKLTGLMFFLWPKRLGATTLLIECYAGDVAIAALKMECAVISGEGATKEQAAESVETGKTTVLFVLTNPKDSPTHRVDAEIRSIENALHRAANSDRIKMHYERVVRLSDLERAMLRYPNNALILHFMGVAGDGTIHAERNDRQIQLGKLLKVFPNVQCVVLSPSYYDELASSFADVVPYVLGIPSMMLDDAAIQFAADFYRGVGDGLGYRQAFDVAVNTLKSAGTYDDTVRPVFIQGKTEATESPNATDYPRLVVPPLTTITGQQHQQLAEALIAAFNLYSLNKMVHATLNRSMASIASGTDINTYVFNLVDWAKRSGYLTELVQGALDAQPRNQKLRDFALSVGTQKEGVPEAPLFLSTGQLSQIHEVLLEAYDHNEIRRLALKCMSIDLDITVHSKQPFTDQVYEFVQWAFRQGRLMELLRCVAEDRSLNPAVQALWAEAQGWGASLQSVGLQRVSPVSIEWITIPAGEFLMGSDKNQDKRAFDSEMPQHRLSLPTFQISKYPITNAQYQLFVDDGGYTSRWMRCWTELGWKLHIHEKRIRKSNIDATINMQDHPIVGVSWYEAVAYCNWLSIQLQRDVRLPSEAEWEKAARGANGRIWPWGNSSPTKEQCNFGGNVGRTTSVFSYPNGASPYGVMDMAGNVLEWTRSLYMPYPYHVELLEDTGLSGERTLRGGTWNLFMNDLRCAARYHNSPKYRIDWIGFRVTSLPSEDTGL